MKKTAILLMLLLVAASHSWALKGFELLVSIPTGPSATTINFFTGQLFETRPSLPQLILDRERNRVVCFEDDDKLIKVFSLQDGRLLKHIALEELGTDIQWATSPDSPYPGYVHLFTDRYLVSVSL